MAVKRRALWFTDEDWSRLQAAARARGLNVSQLVRDLAPMPAAGGSSAAGATLRVVGPVRDPAHGLAHGFGRSQPAPKPGR